jgi:hypothetical protein
LSELSADGSATLPAVRYAIVVPVVVARATPRRNVTEFRRAWSLVAKKMAEMICGPATITIAIGSAASRSDTVLDLLPGVDHGVSRNPVPFSLGDTRNLAGRPGE